MELGSEEEEDFEPTLLRDTAEDVKKRRERDDELTKMIEMSDDEDIKAKPKRRVREYVSNEEEEELEKQVPEVQKPPEDEPVELPTGSVVSAVTKGGRRRGRRKVNKKVQVKDEDGYLVTKLEPAWESFSEEEPAPNPKPNPKPKPKPAPKGKKKSAGPGTGQGSINSYLFTR
jgi:DNA polymerase delta subunit 3